jgi:CDP-2,3-bis-(O-geranylgeranyl)-sn-glycerol synthase
MYLKVSVIAKFMVSLLQVLYLMIPAYVANMAPPLLAKYSPWNAPMDFGLSLDGVRVFGDHKTWAGFVVGVLAALIVGTAMFHIYWPFEFSGIGWSLLVAIGALTGDSVKSFFKRRVGVSPGSLWIPFDQIDYTVGALALGSIILFPGWMNAFLVVFLGAFGHIAVNHIGYWLGVREVKW